MADSAEGTRRVLQNNTAAGASTPLDPSRLAARTVAEVRRVLEVDGSSLTFWDDEFGVLVPLALDDPRIAEPWPVCFPGQGLIGEAFAGGRAVVVNDYAHEVANAPAWSEINCGLAVPLSAGGRQLGALSAHHYSPRGFTGEDVQALELIAARVGSALAAMGTLARAQLRTAQASALATLVRHGADLRDDQRLYTLIGKTASRLLGAEVAGLVLRDAADDLPGWLGVVGNRTTEFVNLRYGSDHPAFETIFGAEMQVVRGEHGGVFDRDRFRFFGAEGVRIGLALPLDHSERPRGSLWLGWRSEVQLADALLDFAQVLAGFAGSLVRATAVRAQHRALVANAPVMLAALDAEGVLTLCEGAGAEAIGLGPADVGRRFEDALADHPGLLDSIPQDGDDAALRRTTLEIRQRTFDARVLARDGHVLLVATDITERSRAERELAHRATHDLLTGLPNGHEVTARVRSALAGSTVSVVVSDIRSFDHVNGAIGYKAADELLQTLGRRLVADVPDAVVVGRSGGDEFTVAALGPDPVGLGERVRASLEAFVGDGQDEQIAVDVRCGVASAVAGEDAQVLLQNADLALQFARRGEAGAISVWHPQMSERMQSHASLTGELRRALATRSFEVAYQPIIDIAGGGLVSVEALARWTLSTGECVSPAVFVPLAEGIGRTDRLTDYVLNRALSEVAAACSVPVSVNISPLELTQESLPEVVREALSAHGVAPSALTLELIETASLDEGTPVIEELAQLGVKIAVDDFGSGWSSMRLLKRLPAWQLKLDRSYVAQATSNPVDRAITRATIELGHSLGMDVVAEGVEDAETLEMVAALGCDQVQGYHLARPMPIEQLTPWLASRLPEPDY